MSHPEVYVLSSVLSFLLSLAQVTQQVWVVLAEAIAQSSAVGSSAVLLCFP